MSSFELVCPSDFSAVVSTLLYLTQVSEPSVSLMQPHHMQQPNITLTAKVSII